MKNNLACIFICLLLLQGCSTIQDSDLLWEKVILPTVVVNQAQGQGTGIVIKKTDIGNNTEEVIVLTVYHSIKFWHGHLVPQKTSIIDPFPLTPNTRPSSRPSTQPAIKFDLKIVEELLPSLDIYFTLKMSRRGILVQQKFKGDVIATSTEWDMLLLKTYVPKGIAYVAQIADKRIGKYAIGRKLFTVGFPFGKNNQIYTEGVLGGIDIIGDKGIFTGGIAFGNSGGGVFDQDYNVIGISRELKGTQQHPVWHLGVFERVCRDKIELLKKKVFAKRERH